jgi:NADH-quinone oxidoreductase subunit A
MLTQFGHVVLFCIFGCSFAVINLIVWSLIRFSSKDPRQTIAYECGMEPVGTPYVPMDIRFYLFGLLFVVFDLESLFIYPWAILFRDLGIPGFLDMLVFMGVLFLGFIYTWKRGALRWQS